MNQLNKSDSQIPNVIVAEIVIDVLKLFSLSEVSRLMKTFELEQMGVQEMNAVDVMNTEGGLFGIDDLIVGLVFLIGFTVGYFTANP